MIRALGLFAICIAIALATLRHSAKKSNDDAEASLEYLTQFDALPKSDRIRIWKAVMQTKKLKERK